MSDIKVICRPRQRGAPSTGTWRQAIALEIEGVRYDDIPEGAVININQEAGKGPAEVTVTFFADRVDFVEEEPKHG